MAVCVLWLSLTKPWVGLQCVSVVFPGLLPEISMSRMSYQNRWVSNKHPPCCCCIVTRFSVVKKVKLEKNIYLAPLKLESSSHITKK